MKEKPGQVRIISGAWRGRKIEVAAGAEIRPTAERAREAVFNRLVHGFSDHGFSLIDARVVDMFAGTGAFGLEALSRGAAHATFIEQDPAALKALEATVAKLDAADRVSLVRGDATTPPPAASKCDLAFLDPPFGKGLAGPALEALARRGWLRSGALVVVELDDDDPDPTVAGYELIDNRSYGRIRFLFLRAN